ncbi:divergent PAP2 family protein [Vibrio fluvialis]|nr:divergent PAP2 family protein [Vibrio fluvialis]
MNLSYLITPFFTWFVTGCTKFAINSIKERRFAFDLIGYGGMPSNHSAIVSSAVVIIALQEGIESPVLVVALALAFIVMLDANSLRQQIGKHAKAINILSQNNDVKRLRERMGHTRLEILVGIIIGTFSAIISNLVFTTI